MVRAPKDKEPNQKFIAARQRLESKRDPGTTMTQEEFADECNRWLADTEDPDGPITGSTISKIEQGHTTWPRVWRRKAYRAITGAATDAELGFHDKRRARRLESASVRVGDVSGSGSHLPALVPMDLGNPTPAGSEVVRSGHASSRPVTAERTIFARAASVTLPPADAAGVAFEHGQIEDILGLFGGGGEAEEGSEVRRRTFLAGGLGVAVPGLAMEFVRHSLGLSGAESLIESSADEWNEIVLEHGQSYMVVPPAQMIEPLMIDMVALQHAMSRDDRSAASSDMQRAAALLAALTAMTVANLGGLRQSRRWWRTARTLAERSRDPRTRVWIRGREVVRALYEQRPMGTVLRMLEEADDIARTAPRDATPELIAGKAQALALAGHREAASASVREIENLFPDLPVRVTADESVFGWPADRLQFTKSFVYSFIGNYADAEEAQNAAIEVFPTAYVRGPAQIELQRAVCLAKIGDTSSAVRHAHEVMTTLPAADHVRPIADLGRKVLAAIPAAEQSRREVAEYKEFLGVTPQLEMRHP